MVRVVVVLDAGDELMVMMVIISYGGDVLIT